MINQDKIKSSDLPEENSLDAFWIHGYSENKEGVSKSSRLHSEKVVEQIDKSSKAVEQKLDTLSINTSTELKKKADAKDTKGQSVVYGEVTAQVAKDNKIPTSLAVSNALDKVGNTIDLKADLKNTEGQSVVYGETTAKLSEANKAKIPNVEAVMKAIELNKAFFEVDDPAFSVAMGTTLENGETIVLWGIYTDGSIYPTDDKLNDLQNQINELKV